MVLMRLIFITFFVAFIFPDDFKNLKVLDIKSKGEMRKYMKSISKDLGVKCGFCHDLNDKSIDTDHKIIAREMILMQQEINKKYFTIASDSLLKHNNSMHVSCWTCHRGSNNPQLIRPNK